MLILESCKIVNRSIASIQIVVAVMTERHGDTFISVEPTFLMSHLGLIDVRQTKFTHRDELQSCQIRSTSR
jgi:hypothetical protein